MIAFRIELAISIAGQEPGPADYLSEDEVPDVTLAPGERLVYRSVSGWTDFEGN